MSLRCVSVCGRPEYSAFQRAGRCTPEAPVCWHLGVQAAVQNESQIGETENTCYCWSSGLACTRSSFHLQDCCVPFLSMPFLTSFILTISPKWQLSAEDSLRPRGGKDRQVTAPLLINSGLLGERHHPPLESLYRVEIPKCHQGGTESAVPSSPRCIVC